MVTAGRNYTFVLLAVQSLSDVYLNGIALPQASVDGVPGTWFWTPAGDVRANALPCAVADAQTLIVCVS